MPTWREDLETEFGERIFRSGFSGEVVPTGSFVVDFLTGIGGFPLGSITEIFGDEGSGKTTLGLEMIKRALKVKRPVLYLDYESTVSDGYLVKLGIDPDVLKDYRLFPDSMEDGWMLTKRFCERPENKGGIVLVDSLAAMPPEFDKKKMSEVIGQTMVGSMAQVMSVACRQMTGVFREANVAMIFVNQERSKIDLMSRLGAKKTTPGGVAVKFYAALRLQLMLRGSVKMSDVDILTGVKGDKVVGVDVAVRIIKNKFAASYRQGFIHIRMDEGIDNIYSALKVAERTGFISAGRGGRYELDERYSGDSLGRKKIHGRESVRKYFADNPSEWNKLMGDINKFLKEKITGGSQDE